MYRSPFITNSGSPHILNSLVVLLLCSLLVSINTISEFYIALLRIKLLFVIKYIKFHKAEIAELSADSKCESLLKNIDSSPLSDDGSACCQAVFQFG